MSDSNLIKLAFVVDRNFFKYTIVTLASIFDHSDSDFLVYILHSGVDQIMQDDCRRIFGDRKAQFVFFEFDRKKFENYNIANKNITLTTFAKFEIPYLINEERVLYLDSDLVILNDLKNLWENFDEKYALMAVPNPKYPKWKDHDAIGLMPGQLSFNAGVIYFNLKKLRETHQADELFDFTNASHHRIKLHDESAFNAVFRNDWKALPAYYNCTTLYFRRNYKILGLTLQEAYDLKNKLTIVHFTGVDKPWQFISPHPHNADWRKYYRMSFGSFNFNEKITPALIARKIARKIKFKLSYNKTA